MNILKFLRSKKKKKEDNDNRILNKALILTKISKNDSSFVFYSLNKIVNCEYVNTSDDFLEKISKNNYVLAIFIVPMINKDILKGLVNISKAKNAKTIMVCRKFLMAEIFSLGIDYYLISDDYEKWNYSGLKQISSDWIPIQDLKKLIQYVLSPAHTKLSQSEQNIIVEKTEFYNGVHDIFTIRSKETASKKEELEFIIKTLGSECKVILDAGCGNGRLTEPLARAGYIVTGIDINENLIIDAKKSNQNQNNPIYIKSSIIKTGFKDNSFDAVLMMWHVICEVKSYQKDAIMEAKRILKSSSNQGLLIIDFPDINHNAKISDEGIYTSMHGLYKYVGLVPQLEQFVSLLTACGFEIIKYERFHWGIDKFVIVAKKM